MVSLRFDSSLLAIYRKSFFQVKDARGRLVRFTVKTLKKHPDLSRKTFAVMTAWNPMNQILTKRANRALNGKLASVLKRRRAVFYKSDGWLGKHYEEGFAVDGLRVSTAVQLGRRFRQYAIFYNDWRGPRFLRCYAGRLFSIKSQGAAASGELSGTGRRKSA